MIVDAFLFAGEAEMLELRLRALADAVDVFMAVACRRTHQGEPLSDSDIARVSGAVRAAVNSPDRFVLYWVDPLMTKVERGVTYRRPVGERGPVLSPWFQHIEKQHRNGIIDACDAIEVGVDDIVLVSDVDEIPRPSAVKELPGLLADHTGWMVLEQRFYSTAIDLVHPVQPWLGTTATRRRFLMPQMMRDDRGQIPTVPDGGHHFSWFGTDDERQRKLETFSHAELAEWDHVEARRAGLHSNGEELSAAPSPWQQDLPAPIMDGTFAIPPSWRR